MIGRTSKLIHPLGTQIETPILVSSFSSKGFKFLTPKNRPAISEVEALIKLTAEALTETALVSAFDLKYYLGSAKNLSRKLKLFPELLFIDSGGYETIEDYDLNEVYRYPIKSRDWNSSLHEEELEKFQNTPLVIISYDNGQEKRSALSNQIVRAKKLFDKFPNQLHDFLIKPSKKNDTHINIEEVIDNISLMKKFHVIGMTEKELGNSISDRLMNLKQIRVALDKVGCASPIHIFGNLDPLTSVLYFVNGAEIFDGLTWLRYGFHEGLCVSKSNIDMLAGRINEKDGLNATMGMFQNLIYMRSLTQQMKNFIRKIHDRKEDEAFKDFPFIGERLKSIINTSK